MTRETSASCRFSLGGPSPALREPGIHARRSKTRETSAAYGTGCYGSDGGSEVFAFHPGQTLHEPAVTQHE